MKKADLQSFKTKSMEDLKKLVEEKKKAAIEARLKALSGQEKNLKLVKNLRVEIARILTLIKEKSIVEKIEKKENK